MSIIGIIASERQTNQIKKELLNINVDVICINSKSIENLKNIKFEIVIIQELQEIKQKQEYIKEILKNAKCVFLNTDIRIDEEIFKDINVKILTFGLKQKSTITVSSICEKKVMISIQRAFENFKEEIIEQQEIPMELNKKNMKDLYNALIKVAIINMYASKKR